MESLGAIVETEWLRTASCKLLGRKSNQRYFGYKKYLRAGRSIVRSSNKISNTLVRHKYSSVPCLALKHLKGTNLSGQATVLLPEILFLLP